MSFFSSISSFVSKNKWFILLGLIIFVVALYYVVSTMKPASYVSNKEVVPGKKGSSSAEKTVTIYLFYADWCPHCKRAKPTWNEVKTDYEGKTVNGYLVHFEEINCTEENEEVADMIRKYKVEGYPTIKMQKGAQVIEFDAKITRDNLEKFISSVL